MFIDILKQLVSEQGKDALLNPAKCKSFLADYTRGEYKRERRLLIHALDAGAQKAIDTAGELEICRRQQIMVLHEEYFITAEAAADIVDALVLVLRGKQKIGTPQNAVCANCGKRLQKDWNFCPYCSTPATAIKPAAAKKPAAKKPVAKKPAAKSSAATLVTIMNQILGSVNMNSSVPKNRKCANCKYNNQGRCNYYGIDIGTASKYPCGY
jgi:hypothetical protein